MQHVCKVHLIAGTRPNVMKIAPLYKVLKTQKWCLPKVVFLEQHASAHMGAGIFEEFGVDGITKLQLTDGDFGLRLGSIVSSYTSELQRDAPDLVVVPGDVDVSLGAALAAKRALRPVAHLEAGLRSTDRRMPEELNRVLIDSISDILLAPSEAAAENLIFGEGQPREKVHFVGNIMIDALVSVLSKERADAQLKRFGVSPKGFAIATFHRPSNVDDPQSLDKIVELIIELSASRPLIFPVHPRTRARMTAAQVERLHASERVILSEPLAYPEFVNLLREAEFVVTDSGGIQEETSYVGTPCLTLRETTERPVTTILGTNVLVSFDDVVEHSRAAAIRGWPSQNIPLWDGFTALRCAHVLSTWWRSAGLKP
ncbi:UDP-N-acetylglucosamine 2-epimerase (non-hydrolyzing) [Aliihoeflea sp. 2WW]|uniref:non-hydrolyzing UDP-N-acetylglucosamine 2-epimerase n=1 Tax=Aliihoeflea sp. 2WW TaxID=1381123 RepID=UPI0004671DB9|nr:UDP-N-acetylglucosamine 2-epimerase (non-hydrolyzing) [Aliihoeflea sp. 2WW]